MDVYRALCSKKDATLAAKINKKSLGFRRVHGHFPQKGKHRARDWQQPEVPVEAVVRDAFLGALFLHNRLHLRVQVVRRAGEHVVFDLVVQPA